MGCILLKACVQVDARLGVVERAPQRVVAKLTKSPVRYGEGARRVRVVLRSGDGGRRLKAARQLRLAQEQRVDRREVDVGGGDFELGARRAKRPIDGDLRVATRQFQVVDVDRVAAITNNGRRIRCELQPYATRLQTQALKLQLLLVGLQTECAGRRERAIRLARRHIERELAFGERGGRLQLIDVLPGHRHERRSRSRRQRPPAATRARECAPKTSSSPTTRRCSHT